MKSSQFAYNLSRFVVKVTEVKYSIPVTKYDMLSNNVYDVPSSLVFTGPVTYLHSLNTIYKSDAILDQTYKLMKQLEAANQNIDVMIGKHKKIAEELESSTERFFM